MDAGPVGEGLGVDPREVAAMIDVGIISVLCERGTGEDEGLHRITFYYRGQRLRLLLDRGGRGLGRG
ncbi:MAG: hypothetical protein EOP92_31855 [Lysobacteraceae bacterium]|nr:MAG: hypothetical protein EOP92_31855 [Xanthomonadaceae bacterium]